MSNAKDQKALTAGASSGAGAYFTALAAGGSHISWWQPIVAAVIVGVLAFVATYGASNDAQTDLAMVARQVEAALHISNLVANTQPTSAPVESATDSDTALLPVVKTGA